MALPCLMTLLACSEPAPGAAQQQPAANQTSTTTPPDSPPKRFAVTIRPAPPAPRIQIEGPYGQPVEIACGTCHATRAADRATNSSAQLDEFHGGLKFAHGDLSCLSCHDPSDYDALRLANGTTVPFGEVRRLCAQCHSTQAKSYEHGAHGGMQGHWDLSRGPRTRNDCVHCHHPHAPAVPRMMPTFKPIDRFLSGETPNHETEGGR